MRFLTILFISILFFSCGEPPQKEKIPERGEKRVKLTKKVTTAEFKLDKQLKQKRFYAVFNSINDITIISRASGILENFNGEIGKFVKKGDIIAEIEANQKKLTLEAYRIQLKEAKIGFDFQKRVFERDKSLFDKKLISQEKFEQSENTLKTVEISLKKIENQIETTKLTLSYHTIKAPFDGVIASSSLKKGSFIREGSEIFRLVQYSPLEAIIGLSNDVFYELQTLKEIPKVSIEFKNRVFYGVIKGISPSPSTQTQLYSAKIELTLNDGDILVPGSMTTIKVPIKKYEDALRLKRSYLKFKDNEYSAFIFQDGIAKIVKLSLLDEDDGEYIMKPMDSTNSSFKIITSGIDAIEDGQKVEIIK
ncbi:efflux RND transporter periplasmic adaptor subunit [bacterium]|nr:efflux RND transporter periplasmic adaptor subunit [bacterium]